MIQLLFLMGVYAFVLMQGADMIGGGAEDLMLLDSWKPIVGPIILPVLGAVPDAAIVFFSGMGPGAQQQLSVGIGALAGSTVMLLTIPWVLSIYGGLVAYDGSKPDVKAGVELGYKKKFGIGGKPRMTPDKKWKEHAKYAVGAARAVCDERLVSVFDMITVAQPMICSAVASRTARVDKLHPCLRWRPTAKR